MTGLDGIVIRAAKQTDAPAISALFKNHLEQLSDAHGEFKKGEMKKYSTGRILDAIDGDQSVILVAADEHDGVCGVLVGDFDRGTVWIDWILVLQAARSAGVGSTLLRELVKFARQIHATKVWGAARASDVPGQMLLSREGFALSMTTKRHWYGLDYTFWERAVA